tara:strand:+ start:1004 stop:2215 length:1212 start_codon:yes stop_codon:yes gene_type:complete
MFKKEDPKRYKEKILVSHFDVKRNQANKLIWFHAASIGELKSILPIIKNLNSNITGLDFLVTTNTLSSSIVARLEFKKFENVLHRFFPFDIEYLIKKFLKLWSPNFIFLVDSEIWPNLIFNAHKLKIPIAIINARITFKSFSRWMLFPKTAKTIFSLFDLCLAANSETEIFLKKLNVKKVYNNGNIKFINQADENDDTDQNENFLQNIKFWVAASTHAGEEELCLKTHLLLKKSNNNIYTIIAPRHIERSQDIKELCRKNRLNFQILNNNQLIDSKKEIIILNSFGILKNYFKYAKSVFIGKSTIKKLEDDGGQNPLEAARLKCKIYHGPYVNNFREIYEVLEKKNISNKIEDYKDLSNYISKDFEANKKGDERISKVIDDLGNKTLVDTLKHINNFILNENK